MPRFTLRDTPAQPPKPTAARSLDLPTLENWLWEAACQIRGPVDAPKFEDHILPLVFLKRLSDVFDDELAALARTASPTPPPRVSSSSVRSASATQARSC